MGVQQVLEDVISPHGLIESNGASIQKLFARSMVHNPLVAFAEFGNRVLSVAPHRLTSGQVLHEGVIEEHGEGYTRHEVDREPIVHGRD